MRGRSPHPPTAGTPGSAERDTHVDVHVANTRRLVPTCRPADLLIGAYSDVRAGVVPGSAAVAHPGNYAWRAVLPYRDERPEGTLVPLGPERTRSGHTRVAQDQTMWWIDQFDAGELMGTGGGLRHILVLCRPGVNMQRGRQGAPPSLRRCRTRRRSEACSCWTRGWSLETARSGDGSMSAPWSTGCPEWSPARAPGPSLHHLDCRTDDRHRHGGTPPPTCWACTTPSPRRRIRGFPAAMDQYSIRSEPLLPGAAGRQATAPRATGGDEDDGTRFGAGSRVAGALRPWPCEDPAALRR